MEQQVYQWIILGILVAFVAFDKASKLVSKNSNPPNPKSGRSYLDRKVFNHEKRIAVNEKGIENICKVINGMKEDNRKDHDTFNKKLDRLIEKEK